MTGQRTSWDMQVRPESQDKGSHAKKKKRKEKKKKTGRRAFQAEKIALYGTKAL